MKRLLLGGVTIFVVLGLVAALVLNALSSVQTSAAQAAAAMAVQTANVNVTLSLCLGSLVGLMGLAAAAVLGTLLVRQQWSAARARAERVEIEAPMQIITAESIRPAVRQPPTQLRLSAPRATVAQPRRRRRRLTVNDLNRMRQFWE